MRADHRQNDQLRPVSFTRHFTAHAEGSVLSCFGNTKVLCNASIIDGVPRFLRDRKQGWITAEYSMLPRSTHQRVDREVIRGKQDGRTVEIQRLIGRSLRAAVDLTALENYTIVIDCDVIQADGGTRTAAISGAVVALVDALNHSKFKKRHFENQHPLKYLLAGVSVGICKDTLLLDLSYEEDSQAATDMNIIMTSEGSFVEMQGTAERNTFTETQLIQLVALAKQGIKTIIDEQKKALNHHCPIEHPKKH